MPNNVIHEQQLQSVASAAKNFTLNKLANINVTGGGTVLDTVPASVNGGLWYELDNAIPIIKLSSNGVAYAFNPASNNASDFLIVDSPLTTNLTDNCGNTWGANGSVTFDSINGAQFNSSYLLTRNPITLGGKDFTISFYGMLKGSSVSYAGLVSLCYGTTVTDYWNAAIHLARDSNTQNGILILSESSSNSSSTTISSLTRTTPCHYELNYSSSNTTFRLFIDGTLKLTKKFNISRVARYVFLGARPSSNTPAMQGCIRDFKIYDGLVLHTENFVPD